MVNRSLQFAETHSLFTIDHSPFPITFASMKIGFDAKRAFHNPTGLGHYSRSLLHAFANYYPEHEYFLFNPEPSKLFWPLSNSLKEVIPQDFFHRIFSGAWRSSWIKKDLKRLGIQL